MGLIAGLLSAGATIAGGFLGADAERDAADQATALQRESRDISLRLAEPGLVAGNQALQQLGALFGIAVPSLGGGSGDRLGTSAALPNGGVPNSPNAGYVQSVFQQYKGRRATDRELDYYSSRERGDQLYRDVIQPSQQREQEFMGGSATNPASPAPLSLDDLVTNNPLIRFNREQGEKAVARGAAARGLNQSGGTLRDLAEFNQDLSGAGVQQFVLNPLFQLAGFGQQSASMGSSAALNTGTNLSNIALRSGDARSSAFSNAGNAIGSAISDWGNARTLRDILAGGGV